MNTCLKGHCVCIVYNKKQCIAHDFTAYESLTKCKLTNYTIKMLDH